MLSNAGTRVTRQQLRVCHGSPSLCMLPSRVVRRQQIRAGQESGPTWISSSSSSVAHVINTLGIISRPLSTTSRRLVKPINGLSDVVGPTSPPLLEQTLGQFWQDLVDKYPNSPALVSRHEVHDQHSLTSTPGHRVGQGEKECLRWTFDQMNKHVDALARGLLKQGVTKGDRIGVFLGNGSAYALLQWALAKIGAVLCCINPASSLPELRAALNLTGCRALIISPTIKNRNLIQLLDEMLPTLTSTPVDKDLIDEQCPMLVETFIVDNTDLGAKEFATFLDKHGLAGRDFRRLFDWSEQKGVPGAPECSSTDVINHQFTSGTTGFPKAVALTHRNILNNGKFIGQCMKLTEPPRDGERGEVLVNAPPNFHCFGLVLGNLAFWTHAGCIVFGGESFDPALTLRAAHLERATAIHGVPTMFIAELNLLDKLENQEQVQNLSDLGTRLDFSQLRTGIAAGSPVPDDIMRRLIKRLNLRDLTITYGLTECSPALVMSTTEDPIDKKCETIGRVMPHAVVKIVSPDDPNYPDPDETKPVKVGDKGELWGGGYAVMAGYWNNEHETNKAVIKDKNGMRWMKTGDQAAMDEQGYIRITGRIKDLIIRGGENLSGVLIEARALMCPGVNDCSVVAVPDSFMGEVPGAFVSRAETPEGKNLTGQQLREHVTGLLGHQHAPDWVWFLGEDGVDGAFPVTQSGKIRKVELRDWAKGLVERKVGRVRNP
ncbi:hypothetical protein OIO90_003700 [Microbotryomycetes sp. JL221]|nr:hypothetical protein OIO90_003700 [Microbotryomycetes sp. JL221]